MNMVVSLFLTKQDGLVTDRKRIKYYPMMDTGGQLLMDTTSHTGWLRSPGVENILHLSVDEYPHYEVRLLGPSGTGLSL